jgi:hypothetical protein
VFRGSPSIFTGTYFASSNTPTTTRKKWNKPWTNSTPTKGRKKKKLPSTTSNQEQLMTKNKNGASKRGFSKLEKRKLWAID